MVGLYRPGVHIRRRQKLVPLLESLPCHPLLLQRSIQVINNLISRSYLILMVVHRRGSHRGGRLSLWLSVLVAGVALKLDSFLVL